MSSFELRWLTRSVDLSGDANTFVSTESLNDHSHTLTERVLQYRWKLTDAEWLALRSTAEADAARQREAWLDVPEVTLDPVLHLPPPKEKRP